MSRLSSRIPLQLFGHWKVVKGILKLSLLHVDSSAALHCSPACNPIPGPLKGIGSHGNTKTGPQTEVPPKPLSTHHLHHTNVLLRCHHAHGVTTKIYFPSGSYSHPWYFWNLLLKQEETAEILDYKKEKKNRKAFQPISSVTSINSRFITALTPTCPQHRARNAQTQQSQHSNRANENETLKQGS